MAQHIADDAQTKGVSFGPILRYYLERCLIANKIDEHIRCHARRKALTHGEASVSMIVAILFQVMQLYTICRFANETTILKTIMPHIEPNVYHDDHLADSLDALYDFGLGNLETLITKHMISEFNIQTKTCHNDTTSASVYGNCDKNRTDTGIKIGYGFSKKHRDDLKQFVWSLSVSNDAAFPLFQEAYSGNTADVTTYVKQWHNLIDLLGYHDFLYVADSKLVSKPNMAHIHDNDGFFVAPLPMYESYKTAYNEALANHDREVIAPYKEQINRGFEVPFTFCHEDKEYFFRMVVIYDPGLFARKQRTIIDRLEKVVDAFLTLETKLNKRKLKTRENINKACISILKEHKSLEFFEYTINNDPVVTWKNKHKGRPPKGQEPERIEITKDHFSIELKLNEDAVEEALFACGYYPLVTNKPDLSIEELMLSHKGQYKSELINRRAKSELKLEPIYLQTPERIEAMLFLFKIALQLTVLIERTARKNIDERDRGLDNFMPNRHDVRNPTSGKLLQKFEHMVSGAITLPTGDTYNFVSQPNALQRDILSILEVPEYCYSYEYLFGKPPE